MNGNWSAWTEWSSCSVSCGDGGIMRKRVCDNPVVFGPGKDCVGNDTDFKNCSKGACSGK